MNINSGASGMKTDYVWQLVQGPDEFVRGWFSGLKPEVGAVYALKVVEVSDSDGKARVCMNLVKLD